MSKFFSTIGQFIERLFITLSVMLATSKQTKYDKRRRQRIEIRNKRRQNRRVATTTQKKEVIDENEKQALFTAELNWAQKGVEQYRNVVAPFPASPIKDWSRFYNVEVVPPLKRTGFEKMYAKAYVECRDSKNYDSAIVFLYLPRFNSKKDCEYKVLAFYGKEIVQLDKPNTIELAKRIFQPLLKAEAA